MGAGRDGWAQLGSSRNLRGHRLAAYFFTNQLSIIHLIIYVLFAGEDLCGVRPAAAAAGEHAAVPGRHAAPVPEEQGRLVRLLGLCHSRAAGKPLALLGFMLPYTLLSLTHLTTRQESMQLSFSLMMPRHMNKKASWLAFLHLITRDIQVISQGCWAS